MQTPQGGDETDEDPFGVGTMRIPSIGVGRKFSRGGGSTEAKGASSHSLDPRRDRRDTGVFIWQSNRFKARSLPRGRDQA